MEIENLKKLIKDKAPALKEKSDSIQISERYYRNENDILKNKHPADKKKTQKNDEENPVRISDNRISTPWHRLLVNQKAAYVMSEPPTFDVGDDRLNDEISKLLGDHFGKVSKDLCVQASNAGVAWLHVWKDEDHQNFFRYSVVSSNQIIPIYSQQLQTDSLLGVLRIYSSVDDEGKEWTYYEYWNDTEVVAYRSEKNKSLDQSFEPSNQFEVVDLGTGDALEKVNVYPHDWGMVPFIPFKNAMDALPDLKKYKKLIDVYDTVYSGFVNDLDDVQQIIFVLTNYGGQNKREFLNDLKQFKIIKLENYGDDAAGSVDTIAVDIPTEARDKLLETTRELIFVQGQGVDPQRNIAQNTSGVALKQMYANLELKASELETEFRQGFGQLIRFILKYSGADPNVKINQTWTRTAINNDLEEAQKVSQMAPYSSAEAIAKNNPLVDNWQKELEAKERELENDLDSVNSYREESIEEQKIPLPRRTKKSIEFDDSKTF